MKQNTRETWIQNTQNSPFWSFSVRCDRDAKIHTGENIVSATNPTNLLQRPTHNLLETFPMCHVLREVHVWERRRVIPVQKSTFNVFVRWSTETGLLAQWQRPTFECNFLSRLSCQSDSKGSLYTSTCESAAQLQCPASVQHATVTHLSTVIGQHSCSRASNFHKQISKCNSHFFEYSVWILPRFHNCVQIRRKFLKQNNLKLSRTMGS